MNQDVDVQTTRRVGFYIKKADLKNIYLYVLA